MKNNPQTARLPAGAVASILAAAALWGTLGLWNRALLAGGFSPFDVVVVRNLGGLAVLTLFFLCTDRSVFRIRAAHLKYFFLTGVVSVLLFTTCYISCQQVTTLAVAAILLYTAPAVVVVLSCILWREPVTGKKILALLLTFLGCAFVTGVFSGGLTVTAAGILLGLGASVFYALYSIFGRYALAHYGPLTVTYWTFVFSGLGSLLFFRPARLSAGFSDSRMWLYALVLAVCATAMPYLFYTRGLSRVESGRASIIASMEPVVAALLGVMLLGEPLGATTVLGIACVLAGVYVLR